MTAQLYEANETAVSCHHLHALFAPTSSHGRSKQSGCSGHSLAGPLFLGKNKIPFYKKQVINKSTSVVFGLVQLVIL